ncbi:MAG: hypothetical protein H3C62_07570 [Gemmatimonadaceae bacterium]|nr:hypothetical protein [Gemmatimonadaceae bacterium]
MGWQDLMVLAVVGLAVAFLVRRRRRRSAPDPMLVTLGRAPEDSPCAHCRHHGG